MEALKCHEKLEELQAFDKELVQQYLNNDELKKQQSQDDSENSIGIQKRYVQNIEAGEAMQDLKDLDDKELPEVDISGMIAKLNTNQKRVFDRVINITESDKAILRLYVSEEGGTGKSFLINTIIEIRRRN